MGTYQLALSIPFRPCFARHFGNIISTSEFLRRSYTGAPVPVETPRGQFLSGTQVMLKQYKVNDHPEATLKPP